MTGWQHVHCFPFFFLLLLHFSLCEQEPYWIWTLSNPIELTLLASGLEGTTSRLSDTPAPSLKPAWWCRRTPLHMWALLPCPSFPLKRTCGTWKRGKCHLELSQKMATSIQPHLASSVQWHLFMLVYKSCHQHILVCFVFISGAIPLATATWWHTVLFDTGQQMGPQTKRFREDEWMSTLFNPDFFADTKWCLSVDLIHPLSEPPRVTSVLEPLPAVFEQ